MPASVWEVGKAVQPFMVLRPTVDNLFHEITIPRLDSLSVVQ